MCGEIWGRAAQRRSLQSRLVSSGNRGDFRQSLRFVIRQSENSGVLNSCEKMRGLCKVRKKPGGFFLVTMALHYLPISCVRDSDGMENVELLERQRLRGTAMGMSPDCSPHESKVCCCLTVHVLCLF